MRRAIALILCAVLGIPESFAALKVYTVKSSGGDYPATMAGLSSAVSAAAAWQGASSSCDDVLILVEPDVYSGKLTFPAKSQTKNQATGLPLPESSICRKFVEIRSTGVLPVRGTRVGPGDSAQLVKLTQSSATTDPVIVTSAAETGYWRLVGLEVYPDANPLNDLNLVALDLTLTQPNPHLCSHNWEFDRVYIHGHDNKTTVRGLYLGMTNHVTVRDSYIAEIKMNSKDSQAISMFGGSDLLVVNSYLEAMGEVFLAGGAMVTGASHQRLATFLGNWLNKPVKYKLSSGAGVDATGTCAWEGSYHRNTTSQTTWQCQSGNWVIVEGPGAATTRVGWDTKNHWELKALVGGLVRGNYMSNGWNGDQAHNYFLINQSNQSNHALGRWVRTDNIDFEFNRFDSGVSLATVTLPLNPEEYHRKSNKIRIRHNLSTNIARPDPLGVTPGAATRGNLLQFGAELYDVEATHNTGVLYPGATAATSFIFNSFPGSVAPFSPSGIRNTSGPVSVRDNFWPMGSQVSVPTSSGTQGGVRYACRGTGLTDGYGWDSPLSRYAFEFNNNVFTREATTVMAVSASPCATTYKIPNTNTLQATQTASPASWQVYLNSTDYTAANGGAAYRTASDGSDVGADVARVNWYSETAQTGARNPYLLAFEVWSDLGALRYNALSTAACTIDVDDRASFDSPAYSGTDSAGAQSRSITFTSMGLAAGHYYARVTCDGKYKITDLRVIGGI